MSALPRIDLAEVPDGPWFDEPSWRARQLWLAVLGRLVLDARGCTGPLWPAQHAPAARAWLREPSADRAEVLALAGIDPAVFRDFGLPRLEAEWARFDAGELRPPKHAFARANGRRRGA